MITLPTAVSNALASHDYRYCLLVNLAGSGMQLTNNHKNITYNSVTYSTTDNLLIKTSDVNRTSGIESNSYTITVAGADKQAYNEYYNGQHNGKSATLFLAFLDDNYDLLASNSVVEMYTGIIDSWDLSETSTTSTFSIKLTNHWSTFEVINGRFTNTSSQSEFFPNDSFFQYSTQEKLPLKWGI